MRDIKYPIYIVLTFVVLLFLNNEWAKSRAFSFYNNNENVAAPIREELRRNELLSDEAEANTIVINLWATWCRPCQKEIPKLNVLVDKYESENTLFLAITGEEEAKVLDWSNYQKYESSYFQMYDNRRLMDYIFGLNPNVTLKKGRTQQRLPTNVVIHNDKILYYEQGYSEEKLSKLDSVLMTLK